MSGVHGPVMAAARWPTNGHLIAEVARVGYLRREWRTLDPTFGGGIWWKRWRPDDLVTHDRYRLDGVDFRDLPHPTASFDAVAFDPPYKLNGRPTPSVDARYGVDKKMPWQERHALVRAGIDECARVLRPGGILLVKCQDQVCSGAVRWQTREFAEHAEGLRFSLVDMFHMVGSGRAQPARTRADGKPSVQEHARHNYSTLLVLRAGEAKSNELPGQASLLGREVA